MKPNQNLRKNVAWATKTASQFDDIFILALWPVGRQSVGTMWKTKLWALLGLELQM